MTNVIELCLSKFVLYTIGQELYLDNLNEQHLNIIKNWYEEYINKILTSDEKLIEIINNNNELKLVKELLPKGNSPSDYDTEEQAMIEFILDNSYELLTPNSNIRFITNKIISFSTEETHSN